MCTITPPQTIAAAVITEPIVLMYPPFRHTVVGTPLSPRPSVGSFFGRGRNGPFGPAPSDLKQSPPAGLGDGGGAGRDAQLAEDVGKMTVDGVVADEQLLGDLLVVVSRSDER